MAVFEEQVGEVVGRVARRRDGPQHDTVGDLEVLAGLHTSVRVFEPSLGRRHEHRTVGGQGGTARDVVGV